MKPETVRRRSPLSWVPTVYFAMGLPFILVNMVSTLMFRGLGIDLSLIHISEPTRPY